VDILVPQKSPEHSDSSMPIPSSSPREKSAARPNHVFVDAARFWSMLGVVALHAVESFGLFVPAKAMLGLPVTCFFKFGTIGFFLISGFLLGERVDTVAALPYLARRLKTLLIPWGFWFSICVAYFVVADMLHHRSALTSTAVWFQVVVSHASAILFESSFWFVPNLAFGLCVLLAFRRYLYQLWFGLVLLAISFVYAANIYGRWFSSAHTTALLGFVSFLWLGSFAARNFTQFSGFMEKVRIQVVIALCVLGFLASVGEAYLLSSLYPADSVNSLRLSNQVFSVFIALLVFKVKTPSWPAFVNVRQSTFGLYLIHWFPMHLAVMGCMAFIRRGLQPSVPVAFLMCAVVFAVAYGACLLAAAWLASKNNLRWTIGLKAQKVTKVEQLAAV
jgi:peptidoglycan/LPS O-acetylase OafA/YrhL